MLVAQSLSINRWGLNRLQFSWVWSTCMCVGFFCAEEAKLKLESVDSKLRIQVNSKMFFFYIAYYDFFFLSFFLIIKKKGEGKKKNKFEILKNLWSNLNQAILYHIFFLRGEKEGWCILDSRYMISWMDPGSSWAKIPSSSLPWLSLPLAWSQKIKPTWFSVELREEGRG